MACIKLHRIPREMVSKPAPVGQRPCACRWGVLGLALWSGVAAFTTSAAAATDVWTPHASFQLEDSNLKETMIWVSGVSYALTAYYRRVTARGRPTVFCTPDGEIQSPELFDILNQRYPGKRITSEQAIAAIMQGLRTRHPCSVSTNSGAVEKAPAGAETHTMGPSRGIRYLMAEPMTLLDWGLYRAAADLDGTPLAKGGPKLSVTADYKWKSNRIEISGYSFHDVADAKAAKRWCKTAIFVMRGLLGVNPMTGKPDRRGHSVLGDDFSHTGFTKENASFEI